MSSFFDFVPDRLSSDSVKWNRYGKDVLPMWIADMDFKVAKPIIHALHDRVDHGIFGYPVEPLQLREIIVNRLRHLYNWRISPDALVFLPGVVSGFNLACHALTLPGDGVLMQTPIYPPILNVPANAGLTRDEMELTREPDGHYTIDFDRFEATIAPRTRIFILCNPHNPVGKVFHHGELEQMARICLRNNIIICSDEIHGELLFPGHCHVPIASLAPEIASNTITLIAPNKTFNIAGLRFSVAIVPNPRLREKLEAAKQGLVPGIGIMGYVAALAAYRFGQPWLDNLLDYLRVNRDFLIQYVTTQLPSIAISQPEGTYLSWLDCRKAGFTGSPHDFFLNKAKVALNDGSTFGRGGEGFVRLNFGCPRQVLVTALNRIRQALLSHETLGETNR